MSTVLYRLIPGVKNAAIPTINKRARTNTVEPEPLANLLNIYLLATALSSDKIPNTNAQSSYNVPITNNWMAPVIDLLNTRTLVVAPWTSGLNFKRVSIRGPRRRPPPIPRMPATLPTYNIIMFNLTILNVPYSWSSTGLCDSCDFNKIVATKIIPISASIYIRNTNQDSPSHYLSPITDWTLLLPLKKDANIFKNKVITIKIALIEFNANLEYSSLYTISSKSFSFSNSKSFSFSKSFSNSKSLSSWTVLVLDCWTVILAEIFPYLTLGTSNASLSSDVDVSFISSDTGDVFSI